MRAPDRAKRDAPQVNNQEIANHFRPAVAGGAYQAFCPDDRRGFVLVAAILASAMGFIDGTVVSIAIPAMRRSLDASLTDVQWINNAYMLALSALILVGGASGDRFGLRRVFSLGIVIFTLSSLVCALAPTAPALIAARAVQGVGAALMVPGSLAIISKAYPKGERGRAIGIWAASSALTTAGGPVLGGLLLSLGGPEMWRLIFAINLPVGAIAIGILFLRVPADRPVTDKPPDWMGAVFATLALGLVAWALTGSGGEDEPPGLAHIVVFCAAGLAVLIAFVAVEARTRSPMMPLSLFRSVPFSVANLLTFCLYFALSAVLFYLPMTLISGWGLPEREAGFVFLPLSAAIALASGPVGSLSERTGPGPLIGAGCLLVAVAYASLAIGIHLQSFWWHVFPSMCLMAAGMSLVVAPLSAAVMGAVDEGETGAASGINNAVSRIAGLIAVAAMGGVALAAYNAAGGTVGFGEEVAAGLPLTHVQASNYAFAAVAWFTSALSLLASVIAFAGLPRGAAKSAAE